MHYAPVLRSLLKAKASASCAALILDMAGVQLIDSTGLAVIIEYFRDAAGYNGAFCLAGLQEPVRATFELVRLDKALPIFSCSSEAKEAIEQHRLRCDGAPLFEPPAKPRRR
jgi:anti-anti-sigma factor